MLRILFSTNNWYGSNARSFVEAARRVGHRVFEVDEQVFVPQITRLSSRIARRIFLPRLVSEYNDSVLQAAELFRPDIFIALKGRWLQPKTLQLLRSKGLSLYNYYPDTSAFSHGKLLPRTLPEYDCVFYSKPFWYADVSKRLRLKAGSFLSLGYDPLLHRPMELDARDFSDYGCDVGIIATHTIHKERLLNALIEIRPDLDLSIWGRYWRENCKSTALLKHIRGFPLVGDSYAAAVQCVRINLGIMSGPWAGASSGDLTTARSYEIPACGGFMLHERTSEVLELYREDEEIACFDSVAELAQKIDYYLAHPADRERIARAGHKRCVPAYSYDNRVSAMLDWHKEHRRDHVATTDPIAV
jgi:spore maturation protein CgeB